MSDYFTSSHRDELLKENKELKECIKRLEDENNELRAEEACLLNSTGELERRIKRLEEAGDKAILNSYLPDRISMWTKAKEAKP